MTIQTPVALTIAGSDSGGGAGIQTDLKTFHALGVHGLSVITCVTAQNPGEVTHVEALSLQSLIQQWRAVVKFFPVRAAKTGMLYSAEIITSLSQEWDSLANNSSSFPLVVDPVMVATSGARLLRQDAIDALCQQLLPKASLITPNRFEAEILAELPIQNLQDAKQAAQIMFRRFKAAILVKGGHLPGEGSHYGQVSDCFFDGNAFLILQKPLVTGINTHGTGCTLSAAISGYLALGLSLESSIRNARDYLHQIMSHPIHIGDQFFLGHELK